VHADPLDAQTPIWSSKSNTDSPSIYLKHTFTFPGSLNLGSPFKIVLGILSKPLINLSLNSVTYLLFLSISLTASSIAFPSPTIPATFSVPALNFLSCAPPCKRFDIFVPPLIYNAPTPFGPLNL